MCVVICGLLFLEPINSNSIISKNLSPKNNHLKHKDKIIINIFLNMFLCV